MKKTFIIAVLMGLCVQGVLAQAHKLWYGRPAAHWLEALPVGNSHLGAMVYGGTDVEQIQINEEAGKQHRYRCTDVPLRSEREYELWN